MRIPKPKSVACRSCNARKVKCSGGRPCKNCDNANECVYPARDRQIKVSQSYVDRLLRENEELRARKEGHGFSTNPPPAKGEDPPTASTDGAGDERNGRDTPKNPLLQDQPWFANFMTSDTPIWIGEASDAAFATRLAQFLSAPEGDPGHLPRTSYVTDQQLHEFAARPSSWPLHGKALFLVQAALRSLNRSYHIVRASQVLDSLERAAEVDGENGITTCKLYALFAIGELYTSRSKGPDESFPGLGYFAKASKMFGIFQERPILDVLETILLLSFYSLQLNRRHTAYTLAGSAVRLATVMGLHLSADINVQDAEMREHRKRVWWTAYTFDRMWAAKVGLPPSIADEEVFVALPTNIVTPRSEDFLDYEYHIASVRLARLAGNIIASIYRRENADRSFSKRVHSTLQQLHAWVEKLPPHLQLNLDKGLSEANSRAISLHLSFNQCLILATRPILLSVLQSHVGTADTPNSESLASEMSGVARSISEACLKYAHHSHSMLVNCWINGSFYVFDFFYTQYLFSASTILGIAALMQMEKGRSDLDGLEVASSLLLELQMNGNFAAREYCSHMERIVAKVKSLCPGRDTRPAPEPESNAVATEQGLPDSLSSPAFNSDFQGSEDPLQSFLGDASLEWGVLDSMMFSWE